MISNTFQNQFVSHNRNVFKKLQEVKKKSLILVEFNGWQPFHVACSYIINVLKKKHKSKIIAYSNNEILFNKKKNKFFNELKWCLASTLNLKTFKIYKSFNVDGFLNVDSVFKKKEIDLNYSTDIFNSINSLKELEKLKVNDILIGDIMYDTYLKKHNLPTIDIKSQKFNIFFHEFLDNYFFWINFFKKNNVKAVIASHGVYSFALPLRIAIHKKINSYVPNEAKLYNLLYAPKNKHVSPTALNQENIFFKKIFNSFSQKKKMEVLTTGKRIFLESKKKDFDYFYLKKKKLNNRVRISTKNKSGVLIMTHSFFDSPHVYGHNLFSDFYEWIIFLSDLSKNSNYKWFIKPHPNSFHLNYDVLNNIKKKYNNIKIINQNYSYSNYKKLGIDLILTVFGSVSKEAFGHKILVINSSNCNPYKNFSFCLSPEKKEKLKQTILNYKLYKKKFFNKKKAKDDLFIYYYMDKIYFSRNYLIDDFDKFIEKKVGGRKSLYTMDFYSFWIKNFSKRKHISTLKCLKKFINSKNYLLSQIHMK